MKKKSFDWSAFRRYLPYLTAYAKETWQQLSSGSLLASPRFI